MNWYHFDNVHISIGVPLRWELPGTNNQAEAQGQPFILQVHTFCLGIGLLTFILAEHRLLMQRRFDQVQLFLKVRKGQVLL